MHPIFEREDLFQKWINRLQKNMFEFLTHDMASLYVDTITSNGSWDYSNIEDEKLTVHAGVWATNRRDIDPTLSRRDFCKQRRHI